MHFFVESAFHRERIARVTFLHVWPFLFFCQPHHMGSLMPSEKDYLSPFLEGGCYCARSFIMAEDCPLVTVRCLTTFSCRLGVLGGASVLWHSPSQGRGPQWIYKVLKVIQDSESRFLAILFLCVKYLKPVSILGRSAVFQILTSVKELILLSSPQFLFWYWLVSSFLELIDVQIG